MAVVGYGYWGPNLARNVAGLPATRLVCVCDRDETRLRAAVTRHPGVGVTTDFDDVLRLPEVEVVAIATPPGTHHRLARQALLAGKHVLVEKPLATSSALALDLVELAERKGLVLMVWTTRSSTHRPCSGSRSWSTQASSAASTTGTRSA